MKSSVEALEGNKVKLYVEVEEAEFERDLDRAFKTIAKEVKLPGFRNGKAPRKVLEAQFGVEAARQEALRTAVPEYLSKAVREHDVDLVATPEIEITDGEEEGPVEFDATCEIRPVISVPGYGGLRVEVPSLEVGDDAIEAAQEEELRKAGTLTDIDRPIETGDFVVIDMEATRDGEEVSGLNTEDWSYEVGQGWVTEDFDEHLVGASAGDVLEFSATPKGTEGEADFRITVTSVQDMELPEATDEWVSENLGEFDNVEAWRANLRESMAEMQLGQARQMLMGGVTDALAGLVDDEPPKSMVDGELNQRVQGTMQQFQAQGIDFSQWMEATGQQPDQFVESMRGQSEQAVKVDLALRAVAEAEALEVGGDELEAEYARLAMQYGQKAKDVRKAYEANDAVPDLVAQIRKSKAMDWLLHQVEFVDPAGAPIERDILLGHSHDDDHDHDDDTTDDPADQPTDETENDDS